MANTNMSLLYPEFWAAAFDSYDKGQYPLKNLVDRRYESQLANYGDTVNVPITPDRVAVDWTPGDAITAADIAQTSKQVILNYSKRNTFNLNGTEMTMSAYDLISTYGVPAVESLQAQIETDIYNTMLSATNFTNGFTTFNEATVIDMGTALSDRKVGKANRKLVLAPGDNGSLMKVSAFQYANQSGSMDVIKDGMLTRQLGFDIYESNGISIYTPADVLGAVNNVGGYPIGTTTMVVNNFADSATPLKAGDIFVVAGDTTQQTIVSTTTTAGNTTGITFSPGLGAAVVDTAVITVTPSRSALAFVPNCLAFAARPYAQLPQGAGVMSSVMMMDNMPIRISVWHDAKLGLNVQYDVLYGMTLIDNDRIQRGIID